MRRLKILRRWFARKFGYARLVCLALLFGFAVLRIVVDPAPMLLDFRDDARIVCAGDAPAISHESR